MKRFIIRMSALATVVVLGLIVIAHAKRGDSAPPRKLPELKPLRSPRDAQSVPTSTFPGAYEVSDSPDPLRNAATPADFSQGQSYANVTPSVPSLAPPLQTSVATDEGYAVRSDSPAALAAPTTPITPSNMDTRSGYPPQSPPTLAPPYTTSGPTTTPVRESAPSQAASGTPNEAYTPSNVDSYTENSLPPATLPSMPPATIGDTSSKPLGDGTGTPGTTALEGVQSPQLTLEKTAPTEIQVGQSTVFQIALRNNGTIAAHDVEIHDEIPRGTRLMSTKPLASRGLHGELVWQVGTMEPGNEVLAEVELMPIDEGEVGSVASVRFSTPASVRTMATKPELRIETAAPSQVLVGQNATLTITLSNPGSGVASGVVIEEQVPSGFQHPAGTELEYDVGDLMPKETRQLQLELTAQRPGPTTNMLVARGSGNLKVEDQVTIDVVAPALDVIIDGPKRRYLDREATYIISIGNPGSASAQNILLTATLPQGLQFVNANNAGCYDEATRTVRWQLEELPVQEQGTVQLTMKPIEIGSQTIQAEAASKLGATAQHEYPVLVEGIAAMLFEVIDLEDPIEVSSETTYEIRVLNQGSKIATNVQLAVELPPEMRAVAAEGPSQHTIEANRVLFEGLSRLAPKANTTYRVRVQGLQPGDLRIRAQLTTDEIRVPVTKEESTRVYSDE